MKNASRGPVLLVGGSGVVGQRAARALRQLQPGLPIAVAGRDAGRAASVAAAVGGPTTALARLVELGARVDVVRTPERSPGPGVAADRAARAHP